MNCDKRALQIDALADDLLAGPAREELLLHLDACPSCQQLLERRLRDPQLSAAVSSVRRSVSLPSGNGSDGRPAWDDPERFLREAQTLLTPSSGGVQAGAAGTAHRVPRGVIHMFHRRGFQIAAAAAVIVIASSLWFNSGDRFDPQAAFAAVIENVNRAASVSFRLTETGPGLQKKVLNHYVDATGRWRIEQGDEPVTPVAVWDDSRLSTFDAERRQVLVMKAKPQVTGESLLKSLREMAGTGPIEYVGEQEVDRRKCRVYRRVADQAGGARQFTTISVDAATNYPWRIVLEIRAHDGSGTAVEKTLSKKEVTSLNWNAEFSPTLFEAAVPKGWTVIDEPAPAWLNDDGKLPTTDKPLAGEPAMQPGQPGTAAEGPSSLVIKQADPDGTLVWEIYVDAQARERTERRGGHGEELGVKSYIIKVGDKDYSYNSMLRKVMVTRTDDPARSARQRWEGLQRDIARAELLGEERLGEVKCRVYQSVDKQQDSSATKIYVAIDTGYPVRLVFLHKDQGKYVANGFSDMQWNVKLDSSLFDTRVPEGWRVVDDTARRSDN